MMLHLLYNEKRKNQTVIIKKKKFQNNTALKMKFFLPVLAIHSVVH